MENIHTPSVLGRLLLPVNSEKIKKKKDILLSCLVLQLKDISNIFLVLQFYNKWRQCSAADIIRDIFPLASVVTGYQLLQI